MLKTTIFQNASAQSSQPETARTISELIIKHGVCYERWNEYEMVEGVRTHTGYALRLCGANEEHYSDTGRGAVRHPVPGCPVCRATYSDLVRVARWILPKEQRDSQYIIEPFDSAFHIAPNTRHCREEIVVTIQITHRDDQRLQADECENRCLKEMIEKLRQLGVLEGRVKKESGDKAR